MSIRILLGLFSVNVLFILITTYECFKNSMIFQQQFSSPEEPKQTKFLPTSKTIEILPINSSAGSRSKPDKCFSMKMKNTTIDSLKAFEMSQNAPSSNSRTKPSSISFPRISFTRVKSSRELIMCELRL